ncbi:hypothetical protein BDR22DRAFT_823530 [Usnea florida]
MGGTAGDVGTLKALLPVNFGHLQMSTPGTTQLGSEMPIQSQPQTTGFSTKKVNVAPRDGKDEVLVNIYLRSDYLYCPTKCRYRLSSTGRGQWLKVSGFMVFTLVGGVMLAITPRKPRRLEGREMYIVERFPFQSDLSKKISTHFGSIVEANHVSSSSSKDLEKVDLPSVTVLLLKLKEPVLVEMTSEEMDLLRKMTDTTTDLVWSQSHGWSCIKLVFGGYLGL